MYACYVPTFRLPVLFLLVLAACRSAATPPQIVQPGAPGQESRVVRAAAATDLSGVRYTEADVRFMQGMIAHHQQAVEMTELLATHTASEDMKKLGLRIQVSQNDEIRMMQRGVEGRGQSAPGPHAHHMAGGMMPGMLTPEEMEALAAAKGPAFDRLFLEGMIKHHGGALTMVQQLFATPGAGQESEIFAFASDVDADQRMEIDRMAAMLAAIKERQQ